MSQICGFAVIYLAYACADEQKLLSENDEIKVGFNDVKRLARSLSGIEEDDG